MPERPLYGVHSERRQNARSGGQSPSTMHSTQNPTTVSQMYSSCGQTSDVVHGVAQTPSTELHRSPTELQCPSVTHSTHRCCVRSQRTASGREQVVAPGQAFLGQSERATQSTHAPEPTSQRGAVVLQSASRAHGPHSPDEISHLGACGEQSSFEAQRGRAVSPPVPEGPPSSDLGPVMGSRRTSPHPAAKAYAAATTHASFTSRVMVVPWARASRIRGSRRCCRRRDPRPQPRDPRTS